MQFSQHRCVPLHGGLLQIDHKIKCYEKNYSIANIAGLCDTTGRVLGLMPHPERFLFATQHPQWTRRGLRGEGEGIKVFRNAVAYFG